MVLRGMCFGACDCGGAGRHYTPLAFSAPSVPLSLYYQAWAVLPPIGLLWLIQINCCESGRMACQVFRRIADVLLAGVADLGKPLQQVSGKNNTAALAGAPWSWRRIALVRPTWAPLTPSRTPVRLRSWSAAMNSLLKPSLSLSPTLRSRCSRRPSALMPMATITAREHTRRALHSRPLRQETPGRPQDPDPQLPSVSATF
jgi:hypothetical protein